MQVGRDGETLPLPATSPGSLRESAEVGSGRPPDLQGRETQRKAQAIARASAVCHCALVPCAVPHRGQPSLQGGAVGREYVEPSRLVDSLREPTQLSVVRPLADSRRESVQGGRCRAQTPAGGQAALLSGAVPSRDMSQPPGKPGRHAAVRGQHEACRHNSASVAMGRTRSGGVMQQPHLADGPDVRT